jgi:hypothetical protein
MRYALDVSTAGTYSNPALLAPLVPIATQTGRMHAGAMVTPLARRRPWQVGRENGHP